MDKVIIQHLLECQTPDPSAAAAPASASCSECHCHCHCHNSCLSSTRAASSTTLLKLVKVLLLITLCSSLVSGGLTKRARKAGAAHGKHFIIHVPLKIRTHHHMHTVYTRVHGKGSAGGGDSSKGSKQTIYKIMGYSTRHTSAGPGGGGGGASVGRGLGHNHGGGYGHLYKHGGHRFGGGDGYKEINYDDYTNSNCDGDGDDSSAHGDMIFNHFSRQDEDYPELEEFIEDEREDEDEREGDDWE